MESLLMLATVWGGHAFAAGLPALIAWLASPRSLRWRAWEWLYFVLPFWLQIVAQGVYPRGGMSSWLVQLAEITAFSFACILLRVLVPVFRRSDPAAGLVLLLCCLAAIAFQMTVPVLSD
jgi:hypothetical protein